MPVELRNISVGKGESTAIRSGEVLLIKFSDRKEVYLISTLHDESTEPVTQRDRHQHVVNKPKAVLTYNKYMGGVDKADHVSMLCVAIKIMPFLGLRPGVCILVTFILPTVRQRALLLLAAQFAHFTSVCFL